MFCYLIGTKMTLRALYRDLETHRTPQLSFPGRWESTHESRAAKRQSRNRHQPPQGQCSAGACPPQGSGWGVAESTAPTRPTKSQLRLFIPWCAGGSRHQRLVRKWCYAASIVPESHQPHTRHWYESMSRTPIRDALKWLSSAPANPSIRHSREGGNPRANIPRKKANRDTITCVQTATPLRLSGKNRPEPRYGAGIQVRWRGGKNDTQTIPGDGHPLSILRVPVATRMSDCYESMSWTPIRDRPIRDRRSAPVSSFQRRLESRRGGAHGPPEGRFSKNLRTSDHRHPCAALWLQGALVDEKLDVLESDPGWTLCRPAGIEPIESKMTG